ncbi:actin-like ATPase domain-containing protein [Tothia fuscella]|uniref:Actin-like ATPase domain-containing protein n=1 Tax=Tothia fuscella TaxID=1048955 RepID=A0A9P4NM58_9PEZI|nr:actin-like ATPase domain-containing protein [Tothia fuscella]
MSSQTPSQDLRKASLTASRNARPSAHTIQHSDPTRSPHTPLSRSVSGLYGSPGSSFRVDEDNLLIFDFGSRYLRAGFAGEPAPRCEIGYGPDSWRRVGDYRQWDLGCYPGGKGNRDGEDWGREYELWRLLEWEGGEMGVVEDRVERLVRECEGRYLLLDGRSKRVTLVVPSGLPRPLLNVVLKGLFEGLQAATITLMPSPVMACVGAGLRSALVVDVGWFETTVTAICEFREVECRRSIRAGKLLHEEFSNLLEEELGKSEQQIKHQFGFEEVEEVMTRVGWCRPLNPPTTEEEINSKIINTTLANSETYTTLDIPFSRLADPAETALLGSKTPKVDIDDHDLPLHQLMYTSLLHLPIDIRRICMTRILFTGGVSQLPGLKRRVYQELDALVAEKGWNLVKNYGSATGKKRPLRERSANLPTPSTSPLEVHAVKHIDRDHSSSISTKDTPTTLSLPPHLQPQESDPISEKLSRLTLSQSTTTPSLTTAPTKPQICILKTLGPWAGASLLSNLRIRGASSGKGGGVSKYVFFCCSLAVYPQFRRG